MPFGGLLTAGIGAATSLIGGLFGSHAANKAAEQQTAMANRAIDFQNQATTAETANQQPFIGAGQYSAGQLMAGLQNGTLGPGSIPQFTAPTAEQARATPGYQFTFDQGTRAVNASAAARGLANSGATLKSLTQYGQGLADTTYGDTFNRALSTYQANLAGQQQGYNQLLGVGQLGEGAAQGLNTNIQQGAVNVGDLMTQIGNSQAAGTVGSANSWVNAINGIGNAATQGITLNQLGKLGQDSNGVDFNKPGSPTYTFPDPGIPGALGAG